MRKPVKKRRVKDALEPLDERIDTKVSDSFKKRWLALHKAQSTNASDVLRNLMGAYMDAIEEGKHLKPPFEIRTRKP